MTKANMMKIIKAENKNSEIKWTVTKNTKSLIEITNDYCGGCVFQIILNAGEGKDIVVKDLQGMVETVGYCIYGDDRWSDFVEVDDGIAMAVKMVVKHFYYYY